MAMEKQGYRDVLTVIRSKYGEFLSVEQVAEFTGVHKKRVGEKFHGWSGRYKGKRLPATTLARQLCG